MKGNKMTDYRIEIKDDLGVQAELPLQGGYALPPSWEDLQALYHAKYPGMKPTPALCQLGHTLDKAEDAYLNADPSFTSLLAQMYFEWIGLMSVLYRELGIGQQTMDRELIKLWHEKEKN